MYLIVIGWLYVALMMAVAEASNSTGTLLGLNYSLNVQPTGTQTGTGLVQSASINGSMAGGQAGTCNSASCSATESRTLTISY